MESISIFNGRSLAQGLTTSASTEQNNPAPFNSGAGFGDPETTGGQPPHGGFFTSVIVTWCALNGRAGWGYLRVCRFPVGRFANPARFRPPFWDRWRKHNRY